MKYSSLALLLPVLFVFGGCNTVSKKAVGMEEGQFQTCPASPNCVSSQAQVDDSEHYILPLTYTGNKSEAYNIIQELLAEYPRVTILSNSTSYIHAVFKTKVMRFTDDVEFYFPDDQDIIHIRSSSRLGYSDMGTNRKRMEEIRALFILRLK